MIALACAAALEPFVKTCGCGRQYTRSTWSQLPLQGVLQPEDDTYAEMRLCCCGSSICVLLPQRTEARPESAMQDEARAAAEQHLDTIEWDATGGGTTDEALGLVGLEWGPCGDLLKVLPPQRRAEVCGAAVRALAAERVAAARRVTMAALEQAVREHGDWSSREDAVAESARDWASRGYDAARATDWMVAGVTSPVAADELDRLSITPHDAAVMWDQRDWISIGRAFTWGLISARGVLGVLGRERSAP